MTVEQAVVSYVGQRRLEGFAFTDGESCLRKLSARLGDMPLHHLSTSNVNDFLESCTTSENARRTKLRLLIRFFGYWVSRGNMPPLLMSPSGRASRTTFLPYIYSKSQIQSLFGAIVESQASSNCTIDTKTIRMLLLLLYATGATSGELRRLSRREVMLDEKLISLGNSRSGSRTIPISAELRDALERYMLWRFEKPVGTEYLFVTTRGERMNRYHLSNAFVRICKLAEVRRLDGNNDAPRIQDLRSTFAVHRIALWIQEGAEMNVLIPALAAYMGRSSLLSGDSYLRMTPDRFERQLCMLLPHSLSLAEP